MPPLYLKFKIEKDNSLQGYTVSLCVYLYFGSLSMKLLAFGFFLVPYVMNFSVIIRFHAEYSFRFGLHELLKHFKTNTNQAIYFVEDQITTRSKILTSVYRLDTLLMEDLPMKKLIFVLFYMASKISISKYQHQNQNPTYPIPSQKNNFVSTANVFEFEE